MSTIPNKEIISLLENSVYALYLRNNVGNPLYERTVLQLISDINYTLVQLMNEDEDNG